MGAALCKLWKQRPVKILYFGLDAAGKTTLLYRLKLGEVVATIPTIGFNVEDLTYNGQAMIIWDVGLRDKARPLIRHYLDSIDGLVFVVDSTDRERLTEAVDDFRMHVLGNEAVWGVPVLVLANKQDLESAITPDDVRAVLRKMVGRCSNDMEVFPTVAPTLEGVDVALQWLTSKIALRLGRSDASWYWTSMHNAVYYPAAFMKTSLQGLAGLFFPSAKSETESDLVPTAK